MSPATEMFRVILHWLIENVHPRLMHTQSPPPTSLQVRIPGRPLVCLKFSCPLLPFHGTISSQPGATMTKGIGTFALLAFFLLATRAGGQTVSEDIRTLNDDASPGAKMAAAKRLGEQW